MRPACMMGAVACMAGFGGPAHTACSIGKIAELPVSMAGLQPMVTAAINGRDVRFVADSGAFYSMITPGTAAELGLRLKPAPMGFMVGGIGGDASVSITKIDDFRISGQRIPGLEFLVGGGEVGGAGLLGQNVLGFRDVEYDLAGGMIRLMNSHDCKGANLAYWAGDKPVSTIELQGAGTLDKHTTGFVTVNGIRMRAQFDTGAATSALTVAAAARAGVHVGDKGVEEAGSGTGIGRRFVRNWIAPFASFAIGGEEVKNTRLRIADFGVMEFDMLVGADFFLSHHVYVANALHRMFFTYNGGPVFNLRHDGVAGAANQAPASPRRDAASAGAGASLDAGGYSRRGAASAARGDRAGALADLDRAIALAPDASLYRVQRARVHLALRQKPLAAADLDRALELKHDDAEALLIRAELRIDAHDTAGARRDADAASDVLAKQADLRLDLAELYARIDAFDAAVAQYTLWIDAHRVDARVAPALNGRCWARALAGRELDRALADCNAALGGRSNAPDILDSRGLVRLRMGDYDRAIADYDRALAAAPKQAWSHYGRGIAKLAKGMTAEGRADIAAAVAIDPALPDRARRYGIVPPG